MGNQQNSEHRFSRQINLSGVGVRGQDILGRARVLVVGMGGLGCPVAEYLAMAGVGHLGLADFDEVQLSNLNRQFLYDEEDVGQQKAHVAATQLTKSFPGTTFSVHSEGLTQENAAHLLSQYDLAMDCTDNFPTRLLINDFSCRVGVPFVHGSIFQHEGQLSIFHPSAGQPCYRCLFPDDLLINQTANCAEAGVLGALCGIVGSWMATEAIKWILGIGDALLGKVKCIDSLSGSVRVLLLDKNPDCPVCGNLPQVLEQPPAHPGNGACSNSSTAAPDLQVSAAEAARILSSGQPVQVIDVRDSQDRALPPLESSLCIPAHDIPKHLKELQSCRHLLVVCTMGMVSLAVAEHLRNNGFPTARSVSGGLVALNEHLD